LPAYYTSALIIFLTITVALILFFALWSARRLPITYDLIYGAMNEAVVVIDAQHRILSLNPSAEYLFGVSGVTYLRQPITSLLSDIQTLHRDEKSAQDFDCELASGKVCRGQNIPMIRDGVLIGRLLVVRDVTAQKKVEASLRASEQHAKELLDAVPGMMFRFHQDGTLLGYKAEENQLYGFHVRVNEPPQMMFSDDFIGLLLNAIAETLETGKIETWVFEQEMPDSGLRQYEARIAPSGMDEVIVLVQDVTERNDTEHEAMKAALSRKQAQALAKFIQTASHEFRTPMTVIKTTLYLLTRSTDPEKNDRNIEQLKSQVQRLHLLLERHWTPLTEDSPQP
jgi:PAS domain-containing protein